MLAWGPGYDVPRLDESYDNDLIYWAKNCSDVGNLPDFDFSITLSDDQSPPHSYTLSVPMIKMMLPGLTFNKPNTCLFGVFRHFEDRDNTAAENDNYYLGSAFMY
jgi:hypothetical protein